VPEAAIDEHREPASREDEVRSHPETRAGGDAAADRPLSSPAGPPFSPEDLGQGLLGREVPRPRTLAMSALRSARV
jgi:hypothetical protein